MDAGRSNVFDPARARIVAKSADDARRGAVQFAADEPSGAGQFVGDGFDAGF